MSKTKTYECPKCGSPSSVPVSGEGCLLFPSKPRPGVRLFTLGGGGGSVSVRVIPAQHHGGPVGKFDAQIEGLCGPGDIWSIPGEFDSYEDAVEAAACLARGGIPGEPLTFADREPTESELRDERAADAGLRGLTFDDLDALTSGPQ